MSIFFYINLEHNSIHTHLIHYRLLCRTKSPFLDKHPNADFFFKYVFMIYKNERQVQLLSSTTPLKMIDKVKTASVSAVKRF